MTSHLTLGVAVLAAATAACFPYHSSDLADGADQKLQFALDQDGQYGADPVPSTLGVDLPVDVTVSRLEGEWTVCVIQKSAGADLHAEDACGAQNDVPVRLETAECEDGSCDVTLDSDETATSAGIALRVVGHAATSTRLHVRVVSEKDGTAWEDAWPVTFLPVSRLRFTTDAMHGSRYAMLVGAAIDWSVVAENVGDGGVVTPLAMRKAVTVTTSGGAFTARDAQPWSGTLVAGAPGTTTIDARAAGVEASATLRAVAATDVVSAQLEVLPDAASPGAAPSPAPPPDIDADPLAGATPAASITLPDPGTYASTSVAVLLTTGDGTRVLGGAGYATLAPASLASVDFEGGNDDSALAAPLVTLQASGDGATTGTLSIAVGTASASVPVTVAAM